MIESVIQELETVFEEAIEPNWDGYGAQRASFESYRNARNFIDVLPSWLPAPEVAIDPDGQVAFEWHPGPKRAFSVSIGEIDELCYAGIDGPKTFHGAAIFHDAIPKSVLELLFRVLS